MREILPYGRVTRSRGVQVGSRADLPRNRYHSVILGRHVPTGAVGSRKRDGEVQVKVLVTGATGVMGRSVVRALLAADHDVFGLARDPDKAATLDAMNVIPVRGTMFDTARLAETFEGCDVVCNVATRIPVGWSGLRPGAWRATDHLRS